MRRRRHVERPAAPSYPKYTGFEPCAQLGLPFYFVEEGSYTEREREVMHEGCTQYCPLYEQCLEWALHRERWGYWAGTTEKQREVLRREQGIVVNEPQYAIVPRLEVRDEREATPA